IFHEVIFGVPDYLFAQRNRVVRLRVHEMIPVAVFITELEFFSINLDQLDLIGGTEPDISAFASVDVADDRLDESAQIPRCAMMHFQHNGGVAIVFDGHSSAKIVGCEHRTLKRWSVKALKWGERGVYTRWAILQL